MLGYSMSPRRTQKKTTNSSKAEQAGQKGTMNESSAESDESNGYETPPSTGSSKKNLKKEEDDSSHNGNEKCCKWWLSLDKKDREERENCIKVYLLSPFLFGVVPPGLEDKVIDWSYECSLLQSKDIQPVFSATDQIFESIKVVEDAFHVIADYWTTSKQVLDILNLKDKFIKQSSAKAAIKCAESNQWFQTLRSNVKFMANTRKEMGDMSFLLVIYHFAGHVQLSVNDDTDILKRYEQDCQLGEEKALELKAKGNDEFSSENYRAARSIYSRAVGLSPFNYIVYGNRAQTCLKLDAYRNALIDAKRAVVLKPDWTKGNYRFTQAVKAIRESEGDNSSLLFFVGEKCQDSIPAEDRKKDSETNKEKENFLEDDDCDSLPDLLSAEDGDTSDENSDPYKKIKEIKSEMPELIDDSSNDSSSDEDDSSSTYSGRRNASRKERKRNKKLIAMIIEDQQARKDEEAKKTTKKDDERKKIPKSEKPKLKEVTPVTSLDIPLSERKTQIEEILREGSKALVHDSFEHASERYSKALGIIDTGPRKSLEFGDKSYVIVLYAYGTAMLGMEVQKKAEVAKNTFENIINSFKSVEFPLAYYGLGRVYYQLNRFQEAMTRLEEGLTIVREKTFDTVCWPGTDIVIEESKKKKIKTVFESILTLCKFPPKPDATCRSDSCNRLKKSIYNNDPDYKGCVRILCNDACLIEYHIHCWKKLKSTYIEKSTEKDFLDSECFTLDCCGQIVKIQIYDSAGLKDEFRSTKPKVKKEIKLEKNVPATTTAALKKKKRSKKKDSKLELTQNDVTEVQLKENSHETNHTNLDTGTVLSEEINVISHNEDNKKINPTDVNDVTTFTDSGMFVLKKTDDEPTPQVPKQPKGKNKKKKKNVQSLDEFLGRDSERYRAANITYFDDEDYDEIPAEPFTRKPPTGWMADPFAIPAHLQNDAREIENSLRTYSSSTNGNMYRGSDPWKMDSIREYVYSSFMQLLKVRGSLHFDSEPMKDNLKMLPEEAQQLVQHEGGLLEFLSQCSLFTIEYGMVTNLEEKLFTDLSKSYKKPGHITDDNALTNRNGNTSLNALNRKGIGQEVKMFGPLESKPEIMDSFSSINGIVNVDNGSKVNSAFPDQNHGNNEGKLVKNDSLKNGLKNTEKTEPWTKDTVCKNDLGTNHESVLGEHRSEDVKKTCELPECVPSASVDSDFVKLKDTSSEETVSIDTVISKFVEETLGRNQSERLNSLTLPYLDLLKQSQNTKEQNDLSNTTPSCTYPSPDTTASVQSEIKLTKEKGIQAKPTVKNKTAMTEPMIEPYKIEYEKLLCESEAWNLKRQEALEKTDKLQKTHYQQMLSLNKKLRDLEKRNESHNKKLEIMDSRYQEEIHSFHQQKHESDEQMKKLQEKLTTQSKADKERIELLKSTVTTLQTRYEEEREQLQNEMKNVSKYKTISQQQAQRACNAEVKLLEMQRDVNLSFFTRALQESEITLHNIGQVLAVNPSPQFHELSQNWQRYISECQHQIKHNKAQFKTFIPQVKEGKPLSTLTSLLQIARPGNYPGPPILHLPPVTPVQKPLPLRSESPVLVNNVSAQPANPGVIQPDGLRSLVSQSSTTNQTNLSTVTSSSGGKLIDQSQKSSNSFEKIMLRLATLFPNYSRAEMTNFIKEVRASKNGSLTGLSFDDIVGCVTQLVNKRENTAAQPTVVGAPSTTDLHNPIVSSLPKPGTLLSKPVASLFKPVRPLPNSVDTFPESTKSGIAIGQISVASNEVIYEDDPCVICHDEMNNSTRNVTLDCKHKFHHECIKKWLIGEQSTCPTCRVHALLPEDFPQLK